MLRHKRESEIKHHLQHALTKRELIDALEHEFSDVPDDAIVLFAQDYGDHGHTTQALPVAEVELLDTDIQYLDTTPYSHSKVGIETYDELEVDKYTHPNQYIILSFNR